MQSGPRQLRVSRKDQQDTQLTIRMSKELRAEAHFYCWWSRTQVSDIVRQALQGFVKEQAELYAAEEASKQSTQV